MFRVPRLLRSAAVTVHVLALGLAESTLPPHAPGHLTLLPLSRLPAEAQLLGKLGLGPDLKTDWLEGCKKGQSPQEWGGTGGVCRLGAGMPRTHAQVHMPLRTSLKTHVQLNALLNKRKLQVCRLGARGKSGKRAGCARHKSGPTPSTSALRKLRLPNKEYLFSSLKKPGEKRPHSGVREDPRGGDLEAMSYGLEFLRGSGCGSAPPPREGC